MFIRSLVGLDRNAAKEAFASFLDGKLFNATQIEFINLVIDHLAANGIVPAARFYESPFTDISPTGPRRAVHVRRSRPDDRATRPSPPQRWRGLICHLLGHIIGHLCGQRYGQYEASIG